MGYNIMSYENVPKNKDETRVLVETDSLISSFGEALVTQPIPIAQITAPYGLLEQAETFLLNGGTAVATNSLFKATSGTNAAGLAAILSRRQVIYKAGQGLLCRVTALFDTPQANSIQQAGLLINTDRIGFGYEGTTFGIVYEHDGDSEVQELTITTGATGSESATVTIDGTAFTVPLTVGTPKHNAHEIADDLNIQVADYVFSSNDDQVVARSTLFGAGLSFAFSSATAVAAWVQITAGLANTSSFIAQANWNVDTRISTDSDIDLDPFKGNVYQIQMQYLGFGGIKFFVEDKKTSKFMLVHVIRYANSFTATSLSNPTFRVGWLAINQGNTISLTIKGGSAAGFIEGIVSREEASRAEEATNTSVGTTNPINLLTIRNRIVFGGRRNRVEAFILDLIASTDTNKSAIIRVLIGATVTGDLEYAYIDKANSTMEIAKDSGVVSGGRLIGSFPVSSGGAETLDMDKLSTILHPGEALTVSAIITSGAASEVTASIIWEEDL